MSGDAGTSRGSASGDPALRDPPPTAPERRAFGATGLTVPAVGMGTWRTFDVRGAAAEAACHAIAREAVAVGAGFVDSSPMYGAAERVLADGVRPVRDRVQVATKVWTPSEAEGRAQVAQALAWCGGRVEVYQVHNLVAIERQLPHLEARRDAGEIAVIGVTHHAPSAFGGLERWMASGRVGAVQLPYNPVEDAAAATLLPLAAALGLGVIVMRPFGEGALVRRPPAPAELAPLAAFGVRTVGAGAARVGGEQSAGARGDPGDGAPRATDRERRGGARVVVRARGGRAGAGAGAGGGGPALIGRAHRQG